MSPLFDDLYATARAQGLPVRTLMSEYAPGQFEITLEHRADALRAVDEAILFKRAVRGVAARHGRVACFMAKPFTRHAGSGMHLHASLADRDGANAFARRRTRRAAHCCATRIGGLMQTLADGMAIYAPNANSYRRFRALSYAPVARNVGNQQPLGQPACSSWTARKPPRRAPRRRRGRESIPRGRARARRHAARDRTATRPRPADRGQRLRAGARRACGPRNGTLRSSAPHRRRSCARRSAASSSMCSLRSSGRSAKNSARSSATVITSGTSIRLESQADIIWIRPGAIAARDIKSRRTQPE